LSHGRLYTKCTGLRAFAQDLALFDRHSLHKYHVVAKRCHGDVW